MAQQTKKRRLSGTQLTAIKASLAAFSLGITVTGAAILAGADALSAQAAAAPVTAVSQTQDAPAQPRSQFRATTPSQQAPSQVSPVRPQQQQPQITPPTQTPTQTVPVQPRQQQVTPAQPQQQQQVTPTQPQQRFIAPQPQQTSPRPFTRSRSSR